MPKRRVRPATRTQPPAASATPRRIGIESKAFTQPTLVGYADRCAIVHRGLGYEFDFFETGDAGRTYVIARVVMGALDILESFWPQTESFYQDTKRQFAATELVRVGIDASAPPLPERAAVLCNVMQITRHALYAEIACHYVTPLSIVRAQTTRAKVTVLPLLAVQVPITLLVSILEFLEARLPQMQQMVASVKRSN